MNKILSGNLKQFIKFAFVGVLNTLIDFGVYYVLTRFAGMYYVYANIISVILAITNSYLINRSWTFKSKNKIIGSEALKFWIVSIVGLILNTIILKVFIYFGANDLISKAIASIFVLVWNYLLNKFWTFKETNE